MDTHPELVLVVNLSIRARARARAFVLVFVLVLVLVLVFVFVLFVLAATSVAFLQPPFMEIQEFSTPTCHLVRMPGLAHHGIPEFA